VDEVMVRDREGDLCDEKDFAQILGLLASSAATTNPEAHDSGTAIMHKERRCQVQRC